MNTRLAKISLFLTLVSGVLLAALLALKFAAHITLNYTAVYMVIFGIFALFAGIWGCIFVTEKSRDAWWKIPAYIIIGAACGFCIFVSYMGSAASQKLGYLPYMTFKNPDNNITVTVFEGGYITKSYIAQKSIAGIFYREVDNGYVGFTDPALDNLDDTNTEDQISVYPGGADIRVEWGDTSAVVYVTDKNPDYKPTGNTDGTITVEY